MIENPLTFTATLGGRERRFIASIKSVYLAVTEFGYGGEEVDLQEMIDKIQARQAEIREAEAAGKTAPVKINFGRLLQQKIEEVWMASLEFEPQSQDDFMASIPMNELSKIDGIWKRLQAIQKLPIDDAETIDTELADGKKKRRAKSSSGG